MRLAIIGSRNCPALDITPHLPFFPDTIVSGGAKGADAMARKFAVDNGIAIMEFLPEYGKFGRKAPLVRNIKIVENCDFLIAFWDGFSRGTKFTIDYARKYGVPHLIIKINISRNFSAK